MLRVQNFSILNRHLRAFYQVGKGDGGERGEWGWGEVGEILLDQIIKTEIRAMYWKATEPAQDFSWASHSHYNKKKPINGIVHSGMAVIKKEIFESYEGNHSFVFSSYFYVTAFCALFNFRTWTDEYFLHSIQKTKANPTPASRSLVSEALDIIIWTKMFKYWLISCCWVATKQTAPCSVKMSTCNAEPPWGLSSAARATVSLRPLLLQLYRSASLCFLLACFQRQQEPDFSQKALINWLYTLPAQLQTAGTVRDSAVNIAEHLTSRAPGISLRC